MATCVPYELDTSCCDDWDSYTPTVADRSTELAWSTLRVLTAGRVGNCPVTVRPCLQPPCGVCGELFTVRLLDGVWLNWGCGRPECSCARLCEIVMPGPVAEITGAMLDGVTLDPSLFRVDDGSRIVRVDGECFPSCQWMDRGLDAVGTFGITYVPGVAPGATGCYAAGVLACEYAKACSGAKCRLPAAVTSLSRQGVNFELSQTMFPDGQTGIREVDAFIYAANPHALKVPPMIWSPDLVSAKHRYTTWQP